MELVQTISESNTSILFQILKRISGPVTAEDEIWQAQVTATFLSHHGIRHPVITGTAVIATWYS
jgi:hypothetical protein